MAGPAPRLQRLPRSRRLRQSREFAVIKTHGRRFSLGCLIINWSQTAPTSETAPAGPRLGVVVSRKVGGAVDRNRAKRWFREVFRKHQQALPENVRLVVIARPSIQGKGYAQVEKDLLAALKQARLWNGQPTSTTNPGGAGGSGAGSSSAGDPERPHPDVPGSSA